FESIVKWNESMVDQLTGLELVEKQDLDFNEWNALNFNLKNRFVSKFMYEHHYYFPFYPHDLTAKIEELIHSGEAKKLNLTHVSSVANMLFSTGAVRPGDYLKTRYKYFDGELMPQLPFFYEP